MKGEKFPIALAGVPYLAVLGLFTGGAYFLYKPLAALFGLLFLFCVFFFRNPPRRIPGDEGIILSPADGVVLSIDDLNEEMFIGGPARRVSIFLSIFNVHVNRSPLDGEVKYLHYRPGKFLPAFKSHASELNEKNFIGIEAPHLRVLVTQVTGFIARRIVCYVRCGDVLRRGQLFGLIKFGSCTELYVPRHVEVCVRPGDKVKGGETVIGRFTA